MVQIHPDPPLLDGKGNQALRVYIAVLSKVHGAIAQLGERLPCTQEVSGSIPLSSTNIYQKVIVKQCLKHYLTLAFFGWNVLKDGHSDYVSERGSFTIWSVKALLIGS